MPKQAGFTVKTSASLAALWQVVNQIGGKERYFFGNILWGHTGVDGSRAIGQSGERLPEREDQQTGDAVDSWKVIVVEPEKQLTLLFGMKAPGLGRLCFSLKIKATIVLSMSALSGIRNYAGLFYWLLMIPAHLFIFRGMAKQIAETAVTKHRLIHKTCVILSCFPLHHGGNHGRMRTSCLQQQWIDMKVLVTGATSGLGRNAVEFLCQKGISAPERPVATRQWANCWKKWAQSLFRRI